MGNRPGPNGHPPAPARRGMRIAFSLTAALIVAGCGGSDGATTVATDARGTIPQPTQAQLVAAGLDELPVAGEGARLDIAAPTFSNPTEITNPLFPVSDLRSAIFSGTVEGKPFHTETTLLPETRMIEWSDGQWAEARVSQYTAYIDGRIEEVALDYYAQADDGAVWYLGEDVFDYDRAGLVDSTAGSWLAGREGPPEMIMPADPQVGDVHRAENIPAIAFEEVEIKTIGKTVEGPGGPVAGAIVARELHDDGTYSDKVFAPGYGEFFSGHGSEVEAMALAVPTDALDGPAPDALGLLSSGAEDLFGAIRAGEWTSAAELARAVTRARDGYPRSAMPPRIGGEIDRALGALGTAIRSRERTEASTLAIDVAQSALDLELRYREPAAIDLARFGLWAQQVVVDAAAGDVGGVRAAVTTMEWTRDRFAHTVDPADLTAIDAHLVLLRDAVANEIEDLPAASAEARKLQRPLQLGPVPPQD